jgi:hypothetical protein
MQKHLFYILLVLETSFRLGNHQAKILLDNVNILTIYTYNICHTYHRQQS